MKTCIEKYIYPLLALLMMPLVLGACSSNDEEAVLSENCYISNVTLGTMKRIIYGKTYLGKDSIYTISFSGALYPMTINQRTLTIENHDPLPVNTQLHAVQMTVAFEGALVWRKANPTSDEEMEWTAFNASDSLDVSEPLHLRIVPLSGHGERIYTLKVNAYEQEPDSTQWDSLATSVELGAIRERKALIWENQLTVWGKVGDGKLVCLQHDRAISGDWTQTETTGAENAVPSTIQKKGSALFMSTTDGKLVTSVDGKAWTTMEGLPATAGLTLVGTSDAYLYAIGGGKLLRSNGSAWEEEKLDDEAANLPTGNFNCVFYTQKNGTPRIVIIGSLDDTAPTATVWAKSWNAGHEADETWVYYTPNAADKYPCPMLENLCVVAYDDGLQALGGKSRDSRYAALDSIFHSSDHGITWKVYENNDMDVDVNLKKAAQDARYITATVDEDQYLWIVVDDHVWRGRINRLGYVRD